MILRKLVICAAERLRGVDGDEEEGQMWKEEPLNQLTLLGEHSGSLSFAFSCSFPIISRDHTSLRSELLPSQINKTLCKILHNAFLMESVEIKSICV